MLERGGAFYVEVIVDKNATRVTSNVGGKAIVCEVDSPLANRWQSTDTKTACRVDERVVGDNERIERGIDFNKKQKVSKLDE